MIKKIDETRIILTLSEGHGRCSSLAISRSLAMPLDIHPLSREVFEKLLSDHYAKQACAITMPVEISDGGDLTLTKGLINAIIAEGVRQGASDIHVEFFETCLIVRMRIDGVLCEKLRIEENVQLGIIDRIKVMAGLDVEEHCVPQDGLMTLEVDGRIWEVGVSILPNQTSERVVMHILDEKNVSTSLNLIGMPENVNEIFTEALSKTNGIIIVAGPTRSGTTTTLYGGLERLNDGSRNILTIEDSIEYAIEGISQTEVSSKVGMTFSAGLRAILRQDPDIVVVDKISDQETANLAVQAALSGHLVLSTINADDAVGAITRMLDMKVEPFLLASTVRAVIAQRLVKRLCEHCRIPIQTDGSLGSLLGFDRGTVVYRETGCEHCDETGFQGHIGVFEAIYIDETIRKHIANSGNAAGIAAHAFLKKPRLASAGRIMVRQGLTTAEEGIRISKRESGVL